MSLLCLRDILMRKIFIVLLECLFTRSMGYGSGWCLCYCNFIIGSQLVSWMRILILLFGNVFSQTRYWFICWNFWWCYCNRILIWLVFMLLECHNWKSIGFMNADTDNIVLECLFSNSILIYMLKMLMLLE